VHEASPKAADLGYAIKVKETAKVVRVDGLVAILDVGQPAD
jgi:hypothetical protein